MLSPVRLVVACTAAAAALPAPAAADDRPRTIPALQEWRSSDGPAFRLGPDARIVVRPRDRRALAGEARQLAADLGALTHRTVRTTARRGARARTGDIVLGRTGATPVLGAEGYRLRVGRAFTVLAPTTAGAFYGGRTLLQLVRAGDPVPRGRAVDRPRFPERGLMVDAGRKHYTRRWLLDRIAELASLKMNYLHLHLSDHQGYRLASRSHPEIVSAQHLTEEDVRAVVDVAARHHVTVVPEIDMPGHLTAALAKHPELQLRNAAGGAEAGVLDVSNPAAVRFARDLVTEAMDLFSGPYHHVGGDEVLPFALYPLGFFPSLEAHAKATYGPGANAKDAIHGFVNDMAALVRARGRTARMWHDDLNGGAAVVRDPRTIAEWWIDVSPLSDVRTPTPQELLDRGHDVLNAGWFPTYFVNGVGGSTVKVQPNLQTAYEDWEVDQFSGVLVADETVRQPPLRVAADEPRLRGSLLHLWNDNPGLATEAQDVAFIAGGLRVLAQKTWRSPPLVPDHTSFVRLAARVGGTP